MARKKAEKEITSNETRNKQSALIVLALLLSVTIGFAYVNLVDDKNFAITQVKVSGSFEHIKPSSLHKIINNDVDGNFFTLDVARLYEELMALDWAKQVWIHRVWPDTLNIELVEQVPIALVVKRGLLNSSGEIFTQEAQSYINKIPTFKVTERYYKQAIDAYQQLSDTLAMHELEIDEFVFDERKSQSVTLQNGIQIVLGRHSTERRFDRFLKAFATEMQQRQKKIKRIDLRYTNGFAVSDNRISNLNIRHEVA